MKVLSWKEKLIESSYQNIEELMVLGFEEEDLEVTVEESQIKVLLESFYDLYEKKQILYQYNDDMDTYFGDSIAQAVEEEKNFTPVFLIQSIQSIQSQYFPVEITKTDSKKLMKQVSQKMKYRGE